ncbi:response regulator [Zavarzinia sp. CC-PAN008]|uniref:response regulator n=1 Tax=Zavarzinia sp. CC-PAN008 TaxID=3243332 RepID=UPI003F749EE6
MAGHGAILVVEDEVLIRLDTAASLEEAGFAVVEAQNADEALALLEARGDIAGVFTDVRMPGSMDGLALAYAVRERWPGIAVIVTSGHVRLQNDELPPNVPFITKPYRVLQVTMTLNRLLQA